VAGTIRESTSGRPRSDIWLYDLERRTLSRLTFEGRGYDPVWTPDGRWVTYYSYGDQLSGGIYRVAANKGSKPELLLASDLPTLPASWTPDGKALLYSQGNQGKYQSWVLPAPGSAESKPRLFSRTTFNEDGPMVSPDGKWVAYDSDESGKYEIYIEPFPGPGAKTQISTHGGRGTALWSRNGRELYYAEPNSWQLMAVDVATGGSALRAGQPKALFKLTATSIDDVLLDVTPDPNRFLFGRMQQEANAGSTFVTITNWFDDLRRRAPVSH